jgi:chromosome segregation ATPase
MQRTFERDEAERLFPLLRSIGREVRTRTARVSLLEERVAALAPTRHVHGEELGRLESELSTQRRELRRAEEELERLGCRLEGDETRILIPAELSVHVVEGFLGQTRFEPSPFGA